MNRCNPRPARWTTAAPRTRIGHSRFGGADPPRRGRRARAAMEMASNGALKRAVAGGLGVTVLSTYAVRLELQLGLLRPLRVHGFSGGADVARHLGARPAPQPGCRRVPGISAQPRLARLTVDPSRQRVKTARVRRLQASRWHPRRQALTCLRPRRASTPAGIPNGPWWGPESTVLKTARRRGGNRERLVGRCCRAGAGERPLAPDRSSSVDHESHPSSLAQRSANAHRVLLSAGRCVSPTQASAVRFQTAADRHRRLRRRTGFPAPPVYGQEPHRGPGLVGRGDAMPWLPRRRRRR